MKAGEKILSGDRVERLREACRRHRVKRLELFGSAAGESFDGRGSDVDFLVEFEELEPGAHADAYFGLLEDLENLFRRPVDLVMIGAVTNPYFLSGIESSRKLVYAP